MEIGNKWCAVLIRVTCGGKKKKNVGIDERCFIPSLIYHCIFISCKTRLKKQRFVNQALCPVKLPDAFGALHYRFMYSWSIWLFFFGHWGFSQQVPPQAVRAWEGVCAQCRAGVPLPWCDFTVALLLQGKISRHFWLHVARN